MTTMNPPLHGIRVLDLTNIVAGPLATYQMVMMGAEVIKIETPKSGDLSRKMGADKALAQQNMGVSFCANNAGKKSLSLNLKAPEGKAIFLRMVKEADVVIENFRPGVMKRLGLDYEKLKALNTGLIYCSVSGFGQEGPLSQRPAYDQIVQGFSGLMSLTGNEKTAPTRAGYIACDAMGAMSAAFAICAALVRKQKTGEGECIDVSLLDATLSTMAVWVVSNYLNAGAIPKPMGNENHTAAPSGTFQCREGQINIVNNEEHQFMALCDVLGHPQWKTDARFNERHQRIAHREILRVLIEKTLSTQNATFWEKAFTQAGVPVGPVFSVPQVLAQDQIAHRGLLKTFPNALGEGRDLTIAKTGYRLSNTPPDVMSPPPRLGEHGDEILKNLGYDEKGLIRLKSEGVI
jgi:crotonobetainyl-CoA:carnitine CoA-transferase CaiB-like acyl-CoA transferase